jgi:oxygen-independent coproporphyrinogen-3 oxidase
MIALPEQTPEKLRRSAERLAALPIQHISAYILKPEDGTPFAGSDLLKALPDDELSAALYLETVQIMAEHGFAQYEISNFARKGFEGRHNCRYWKCQDYLGIGPAAHSCYQGKRFAVPRDIELFSSSAQQPVEITDDAPYGFEEKAMLGLRLTEGIDLRDFPEHRDSIERKVPALAEAGYINFDGSKLSLTPEGFLVSNAVIGQLIF